MCHAYLLVDAYCCVAYMFMHTVLRATALVMALSVGTHTMRTYAALNRCYTCMHHALGHGAPDSELAERNQGIIRLRACWV